MEPSNGQTSLAPNGNFAAIPILDFELSQSSQTKSNFLTQLRQALVVVGFFYLKNPPVEDRTLKDFVDQSKALYELPLEKKLKMDMANSRHFLGYSTVGCEKTAQITDFREIFDFLTPMPAPGPDDPVYLNVMGPSQWPDEEDLPTFRSSIENYLSSISCLGWVMMELVAEALDLEPSSLFRYFNQPIPRNKLSIVRYCLPEEVQSTSFALGVPKNTIFQGVGPHKDGGFLTYLLQMTGHTGLEAQNRSGNWIPIPPIANTFVINVGRSLESLTKGVCQATTHRVNLSTECFYDSDGQFLGPRFSSPVFQTLKPDLSREELMSFKLPKHIEDLVKDQDIKSDAEAYFNEHFLKGPGKGTFIARLTSHPDVARRWYPELLEEALKGQRGLASAMFWDVARSRDGSKGLKIDPYTHLRLRNMAGTISHMQSNVEL